MTERPHSQTLFEDVKSKLLSLNQAQRAELVKMLNALNANSQAHPRDASAGLYDEMRRVLNLRCNTNLPNLHEFKRANPQIVNRIGAVNQALEQMMAREFTHLTRQEHDSVKALLVDITVSHLFDKIRLSPEPMAMPTPQRVLDALAVPEQVMDEQFPGYRRAGVLGEMLLRFVRRKI